MLRQWFDVHRQLKSLCVDHKLRPGKRHNDYGQIHRSLITGLLSGIAYKTDSREYTGAGGIKFNLWPGSGLRAKPPDWILAAEIVETGKRYARTVAKIDPTWIEPLAEHLVKRSFADPYWSKKRQSAMADERVSLFGLPIVARRPIRYGPIDPTVSRQLLIEHGLVGQQMRTQPKVSATESTSAGRDPIVGGQNQKPRMDYRRLSADSLLRSDFARIGLRRGFVESLPQGRFRFAFQPLLFG